MNWSTSWTDLCASRHTTSHAALCPTQVNPEVSSYGFIYKLMWKPANEWADDKNDEEKESNIFMYGFLWSTASSANSVNTVTSWASTGSITCWEVVKLLVLGSSLLCPPCSPLESVCCSSSFSLFCAWWLLNLLSPRILIWGHYILTLLHLILHPAELRPALTCGQLLVPCSGSKGTMHCSGKKQDGVDITFHILPLGTRQQC